MKFKAYFFMAIAIMTALLCFKGMMESKSVLNTIYNAVLAAINVCYTVYWIKSKKLNA